MTTIDIHNTSLSEIDELPLLNSTKVSLALLYTANYDDRFWYDPKSFIIGANIFTYNSELIDFDLYPVVKFYTVLKKYFPLNRFSDSVKTLIAFIFFVNGILIIPRFFKSIYPYFVSIIKLNQSTEYLEKYSKLQKLYFKKGKKIKIKDHHIIIAKGIDDYCKKIMKTDNIVEIIEEL